MGEYAMRKRTLNKSEEMLAWLYKVGEVWEVNAGHFWVIKSIRVNGRRS